jgi:hypothetical protein
MRVQNVANNLKEFAKKFEEIVSLFFTTGFSLSMTHIEVKLGNPNIKTYVHNPLEGMRCLTITEKMPSDTTNNTKRKKPFVIQFTVDNLRKTHGTWNNTNIYNNCNDFLGPNQQLARKEKPRKKVTIAKLSQEDDENDVDDEENVGDENNDADDDDDEEQQQNQPPATKLSLDFSHEQEEELKPPPMTDDNELLQEESTAMIVVDDSTNNPQISAVFDPLPTEEVDLLRRMEEETPQVAWQKRLEKKAPPGQFGTSKCPDASRFLLF